MSEEKFLRPDMEVLPEEALIPARNLISPAPNRFTHELVAETPFYYGREADSKAPDGRFEAGTKVVLLVRGTGERCRVVDGRGIYAEVSCENVVELPRA